MKWLFALALLLVPMATAQTADIPALVGNGTERFIAGWYSSNGATIPAQTTQFFPLFGDSSPRTTETDSLVHATMHYNITNFRVVSNAAACGGLGVGETFSLVLRKNQVATTLTGSCSDTSAANSFTLDTDIVSVQPGDRLSISVMSTALLVGRALRIGVSLEGFKTIEITTNPVSDMVNEILDAFTAIAPFIALILVVIWAEVTREILIYALGIIVAGVAMVAIWTEIESLRIVIGAVALFLAVRGFTEYKETNANET